MFKGRDNQGQRPGNRRNTFGRSRFNDDNSNGRRFNNGSNTSTPFRNGNRFYSENRNNRTLPGEEQHRGYVSISYTPKKKTSKPDFKPVDKEDDFSLIEKWEIERNYLEGIKTSNPGALKREVQNISEETLKEIGIQLPIGEKPLGFIKYHPADFIVEEITQDNDVVNISSEETVNHPVKEEDKDKLWEAELVKMGISTLDAIKQMSETLKLETDFIGFAGLKDDIAITSQKVSFRKTRPQNLNGINNKHFFLKNVKPGARHIKKGELNGNRFTILVRTEKPVDAEVFKQRIEEMSNHGFWNFFWLQRFGNRSINHKIGALVLRGNYRAAIYSQIFDTHPTSSAYINSLREAAKKCGGNWKSVRKIFEPLPYTFRYELTILDYLIEHPGEYENALKLIPELLTLWVYAYSSYVANEKISELVNIKDFRSIPRTIPLLMSDVQEEINFYENQLKRDHIPKRFDQNIYPFTRNIKMTSRQLPTRVRPTVHGYTTFKEGFIINFDLPKGCYATTFLGHLFTLLDDKAVPEWVASEVIDVKQALQTGEITSTYQKFGEFNLDREMWQHY